MAQHITQNYHPSDLPLLNISPVRYSCVCFRDSTAPQRALERPHNLEVLKTGLIWVLLGCLAFVLEHRIKATNLEQNPIPKGRESCCPNSHSVSWLLNWCLKLHCQVAWQIYAGHSFWDAGSQGGRHTLVIAFLKP